MRPLSRKVAEIAPSATIEISDRTGQMRAAGIDVIGLSIGEPDFPTPAHITRACIDALERGETHYAPSPGIPALREAIAGHFGLGLAAQPFAALVNVAWPKESRVLMLPLAASAGGWGQFQDKGGWATYEEPAFLKMADFVRGAIQRGPAVDIEGCCGQTPCQCRGCWVRAAEREYRDAMATE